MNTYIDKLGNTVYPLITDIIKHNYLIRKGKLHELAEQLNADPCIFEKIGMTKYRYDGIQSADYESIYAQSYVREMINKQIFNGYILVGAGWKNDSVRKVTAEERIEHAKENLYAIIDRIHELSKLCLIPPTHVELLNTRFDLVTTYLDESEKRNDTYGIIGFVKITFI